jgi:hypothetical protein
MMVLKIRAVAAQALSTLLGNMQCCWTGPTKRTRVVDRVRPRLRPQPVLQRADAGLLGRLPSPSVSGENL